MYEHKDGQGTLFQNDKGDNPARPDYRGDVMIDGKIYEIAGWKKQGAKGTYLSLKMQEPRRSAPDPNAAGAPAGGGPADLSDEIPF